MVRRAAWLHTRKSVDEVHFRLDILPNNSLLFLNYPRLPPKVIRCTISDDEVKTNDYLSSLSGKSSHNVKVEQEIEHEDKPGGYGRARAMEAEKAAAGVTRRNMMIGAAAATVAVSAADLVLGASGMAAVVASTG